MTVEELMAELETMDPESDVRMAQQPGWPFEYSIAGVQSIAGDDDNPPVIYLVEDVQLGYLPQAAGVAIGWSE